MSPRCLDPFFRFVLLIALCGFVYAPAQAQQSSASPLSKAAIGTAGRADRPSSRSLAFADADGIDLSNGGCAGRALGQGTPRRLRHSPGRCHAKATLGSERQGSDRGTSGIADDERQVGVDAAARRCLPGTAGGAVGGGPTFARASPGSRAPQELRATNGQNGTGAHGTRHADGPCCDANDRHRAGQPRVFVRSRVRSQGRLR